MFWLLSAAFAVGLFVAYRDSWWFMFDDLTMFGSRLEAHDQHGVADLLLRRHFEHLMAGTIAWNLVLGKLFGLMSYTPWMATIVVALVGAAAAVRSTMRALGLPSLFAAAAAPMLLIWGSFGSVGFWMPETVFAVTAALFLAQLLLADHDGAVSRRDVVGAALGCLAVFVHSAAVVGVVGVVVLMLARRRRRAALLAAVPVACYGLWRVTYGRQPNIFRNQSALDAALGPRRHDLGEMLAFIARTIGSTVHQRFALVWAVLVVALAAQALRSLRGQGRPFRLAVVLVSVALVDVCALAWARSSITSFVAAEIPGRYAVMVAMPLLPVACVGAHSLVAPRLRHVSLWGTWAFGALVIASLVTMSVVTRRAEWRELGWIPAGTRATLVDLAASPDLDRRDAREWVFPGVTFVDMINADVVRLRDQGWLHGSQAAVEPSAGPVDG